MTAQDADLDRVTRGFFASRPVAADLDEWQAACRAAENASPPEPCIIPPPDFPYSRPRPRP